MISLEDSFGSADPVEHCFRRVDKWSSGDLKGCKPARRQPRMAATRAQRRASQDQALLGRPIRNNNTRADELRVAAIRNNNTRLAGTWSSRSSAAWAQRASPEQEDENASSTVERMSNDPAVETVTSLDNGVVGGESAEEVDQHNECRAVEAQLRESLQAAVQRADKMAQLVTVLRAELEHLSKERDQ